MSGNPTAGAELDGGALLRVRGGAGERQTERSGALAS
jgi:hypothetical protein